MPGRARHAARRRAALCCQQVNARCPRRGMAPHRLIAVQIHDNALQFIQWPLKLSFDEPQQVALARTNELNM